MSKQHTLLLKLDRPNATQVIIQFRAPGDTTTEQAAKLLTKGLASWAHGTNSGRSILREKNGMLTTSDFLNYHRDRWLKSCLNAVGVTNVKAIPVENEALAVAESVLVGEMATA